MKRPKRRLPIPQHEFSFTPDTFSLFADSAQDGERLARERAEAEQARQLADTAQVRLPLRIPAQQFLSARPPSSA